MKKNLLLAIVAFSFVFILMPGCVSAPTSASSPTPNVGTLLPTPQEAGESTATPVKTPATAGYAQITTGVVYQAIGPLNPNPSLWPACLTDGVNNSYPDYCANTITCGAEVNQGAGVEFDLGTAKPVVRIVERGYAIPDNTVAIEYSDDEKTWTSLGANFPAGTLEKTWDFNSNGAISARYWKWYISNWTDKTNPCTNYYTFENHIYTAGTSAGSTLPTPQEAGESTSTPAGAHETLVKGTILASADVTPANPAVLNYKKDENNGITVTVPSGSVKDTQKLTIADVPSLPKRSFEGTIPVAAYDVSIGDLHTFDNEIIAEVSYDPRTITPDDVAQNKVLVSYWDPDKNAYISLPFKVDAENHKVKFATRHLCITVLEKLAIDNFFYLSDHFTVMYTRNNIINDKELNDEAWSGRGGGRVPGVTYESPKVPLYAQDVAAYAEVALQKYNAAGFATPVNASSEALDDNAKMVIKVDSIFAQLGASAYDKVYERIHILTREAWTPKSLKPRVAHELFHAVQHQYFNAGQMALRTWWLESTAEYAGYAFVWDKDNVALPEILPDYLTEPLTTMGGKHQPSTWDSTVGSIFYDVPSVPMHGYSTAYFIDYLVSRGADFHNMWTFVANESASDPDVLTPLSKYLKASGVGELGTLYNDFAKYMVFDPASPVVDAGVPKNVAPGMVNVWAFVKDDYNAQTYSLQMEPNYASQLLGVRVKAPASGGKRNIKVELDGTLPQNTSVAVYLLPDNKRSGASLLGSLSTPITAAVGESDALYVLAMNDGKNAATVNVKVSDTSIASVPFTIDMPGSVNSDAQFAIAISSGTTKNCHLDMSVGTGGDSGKNSIFSVGTAPTGVSLKPDFVGRNFAIDYKGDFTITGNSFNLVGIYPTETVTIGFVFTCENSPRTEVMKEITVTPQSPPCSMNGMGGACSDGSGVHPALPIVKKCTGNVLTWPVWKCDDNTRRCVEGAYEDDCSTHTSPQVCGAPSSVGDYCATPEGQNTSACEVRCHS